jgi:hypothetical protein
MYGNSAVNDIKADFEETLKSCHKIDVEYCNKISTVKKVTAMFLKMFAPLL